MSEWIDFVCAAWASGGAQRVSAICLAVLPVCIIIQVLHLISIFWPKSGQSRDGKEFKEGK